MNEVFLNPSLGYIIHVSYRSIHTVGCIQSPITISWASNSLGRNAQFLMGFQSNQIGKSINSPLCLTRWAPTSCKWSYTVIPLINGLVNATYRGYNSIYKWVGTHLVSMAILNSFWNKSSKGFLMLLNVFWDHHPTSLIASASSQYLVGGSPRWSFFPQLGSNLDHLSPGTNLGEISPQWNPFIYKAIYRGEITPVNNDRLGGHLVEVLKKICEPWNKPLLHPCTGWLIRCPYNGFIIIPIWYLNPLYNPRFCIHFSTWNHLSQTSMFSNPTQTRGHDELPTQSMVILKLGNPSKSP